MKNFRIYINANTLSILSSMPKEATKNQLLKAADFNFSDFYKALKKGSSNHYLIIDDNPKEILKKIKKKLTLIKAAGGLVTNSNGEFLFIFRNKKWDLPKGKLEKGEKVKETAVREVEEECGVTIAQREEKLCKTYHIYELSGKVILKQTTWYKMRVEGNPKLVPQVEEGITTASWVPKMGISSKMKNTYPLIFDVLKAEGLA